MPSINADETGKSFKKEKGLKKDVSKMLYDLETFKAETED